MTIENLKQIAIKYATTKGSRVPLAPDELCNAVVQYMNSFFSVMTDINTIKVAVTENSGNIVFTITGNTYDGKPITPIVITVDHNDFVTDQEFEEFKTNILDSIDSLNNSITEINNTIKNINDTLENNTTDITGLKNRVDNTETNISEINSTLNNKRSVISSPASSYVVYTQANGLESNLPYSELANQTSTNIMARRANGTSDVKKGISGENVANMENIADVESKIPDVSNFATKDEIPDVSGFATKSELSEKLDISGGTMNGNLTVAGTINTGIYLSRGSKVIDLDVSNTKFDVGNAAHGINILSSNRPTVKIGENTYNIAFKNDIPEYTSVHSVIYDNTNGAIIAYGGANEIHIPLLAGENVTIDASEDNKKIVISAAGGGGAGDVTAAGNNIFTGENEFRNYTYDTSYFCFVDTKEDYLTNGYTTTITNGGFDISYYENGEGKYWTTYADNQIINKDIDMEGEVVIKFPKKEGTFALTSDIINEPIYFISFYANEPSEPCHLIGTMMSKNSYGTGQKTNDEFAVILADNLYTNSNEGLAAYGRLANKDILCIYSEDGLSIRCLDEENSEVDLPTVMFFVMETEL